MMESIFCYFLTIQKLFIFNFFNELINYFFLPKKSKKIKNLKLKVKKVKVNFNLKIMFNLRNLEILINIQIFLHFCLVFSSNSSGELHIFRHDGNSFRMDCTKVGIFK